MKKLSVLLATAAVCFSMAGCGSIFSSGDAAKPAGGAQSAEIKITDSYTHKDPEGMEYAARYAYTSGKNVQELIDSFKEYYDLDIVEQFMIIYGDAEDKPLAQYEYYVMSDEEQAQACCELLGSDAFQAEGNIAVGISDAETTQMMIDMNRQYGSLEEASCSAYASFMKDVNFFMDVE